jgi:hypothetical protein
MQESFNRMLEQYEFLSAQIDKQTQLLRELSETARLVVYVGLTPSRMATYICECWSACNHVGKSVSPV